MLYHTSYMYIYDMYSAIQLVRVGHMHSLHMLCNILSGEPCWLNCNIQEEANNANS